MKSRKSASLIIMLILMLGILPITAAADDPLQVEDSPQATTPQETLGIDAVSWRYAFSSSSGTFTEITGGTVHGTASNDDTSFPAIDLGFTFTYDGVDYTQVSIQSNGFIAMGPTVSSSYTPISTGSSNNVISALGRDLQGNGTDSELMSLMEGTAPNRVFTVQWKHYKRYGSSYVGDDLNFQIKLHETSNLVEVVYGPFTVVYYASPPTVEVGMRGASNADFNNRMTDATHGWSDSLAGTANSSAMALSDVISPTSGLTYDWAIVAGVIVVDPETQAGQVCKGGDVFYDLTLFNATGVTTTFDLTYTSTWPYNGPTTSPELADGTDWDFQVSVHIPWTANAGDSDVLTVTVTGGGETDSATATTTAGILAGWTDYADAPRPVRAPSIVYHDGKLYKIGGYDGAAQAYLDIYDIATDTWTTGADMPGARYWIDCEAIGDGIYCAGGYLTSGQTTLYRYDIPSDSWSTLAAMSAYRYSYASATLNGKLYIIGGYGAAYQPTLWEYDPGTDTWNYGLPSMAQGRRYHSAGVIGGKIYVAGGYKSPSPYYLDSVEIYDPVLNTWSAGPTMPTTWLNAADGVKHDRYLILAGGDDNSTAAASNLGWMLDTVTGAWSAMPNMDHALYSAEGDSDGSNFWVVSGRLYDGAYSYSPYTTLLNQCDETCTPVSNLGFIWEPDPALTGNPVVFHATADGSPPIYFDWDFGDSGTGVGPNPAHIYAAAGDYLVEVVGTNCDGASTSTYSDTITIYDPPTIEVTPASLDVTHCDEDVTEHVFQVCNLGDLPLEWEVTEISPTMRVAIPAPAQPLATMPAAPVERPVITSPEQCALYENYTGVEPIGAAEFCGAPSLAAMPSSGIQAPTDIGYAQDIGYISDNFVTFVLNDFTGQTVVGTNTNAYYGMDFDPAAEVLYALNDTTDELGTIDLATGAFTALVPCAPGGGAANWTGLSIDPVSGVFYGSTATDLYIIDPATGNSTLVGAFGSTLMIDIAMNTEGQMYGHDIGTDSIYSIDPTTGAATLIGLTGYLANYAQGLDFDNDDGTLYIFLYIGSGANVYGTVDLTTGAVTPLSVDAPLGEFEGATQTAGFVPDIPWMTEVPTNGLVLADQCAMVTVTLDSTGLPVDMYFAGLEFESNDPVNPEVTVPVTLTVGCPDVVVEPGALAAELCPDATELVTFTIWNTGTMPLDWTLTEAAAAGVMAHSLPASAAVSRAGRTVELAIDAAPVPGGSAITSPPATDAAVALVLDDGSVDNNIGIGGTWEFIFLNRFTPDPGEYPFVLEEIQIYFDSTGLAQVGDEIVLAVYENTSGNYDPAVGSNWLASFPTTVQAVDAWNVYTLTTPMLLNGPGDVLIGVVALEVPGTSYWPAAIDQTTTQQRSWAGWWLNTPPPMPPILPPDDSWTLIDAYFPGNWMIRGYGETYAFDVPWLSEDPVAGTVLPGESQVVEVTFDATGLAPGDYAANLLLESNDPDTPLITVPVNLTVWEPAAIITVTYAIDYLEVSFDATVSGTLPISYTWDFGDGNGSTEEDPVYAFEEAGCYTVTLTVNNLCGPDVWSELICVESQWQYLYLPIVFRGN